MKILPETPLNLFPRFLIAALLTALTLVSAHAGFKRINQPNPADPMAVQIYQLDNGLTVYLTENHETPRFESEIAVRAGSKHDPAESTGLAHYLEHLLFKGTTKLGTLDYAKEKVHLDKIAELYEKHFRETDPEKRKAIYAEINKESQLASQYAIPNELDKLYKSMGESGLNAHTYHEETVYKVGLPANHLEQWVILESERFLNPVFRLFQPELEIVYEEKNRALDDKMRIVHYAVNDILFKKHPYGQQTTIGEVEHLKNPSLNNVQKFFDTYYVPNNMAILISGDINPAETMKLIDKHFSAWKRKDLPKLPTWTEEPLKGAERVTVNYQGEEYVMLAFRTVGQSHPDAETLMLIDMILSNASAGLIDLNLNQQQKVRQAGSSPELLNDYGVQYLYGIPKKDQSLKEVEDLLLEQVELVKQGKFEDWILPAIITDFKKNHKAALESDDARVALMRTSFLAFEDWNQSVAQISRMEKLTRADVIRVANKYYGTNYVAGYRVDKQHEVPKIEKPAIEKIAIDPTRQSKFFAEIAAMPVKEITPVFVDPKDYTKTDLRDGVKVYYSKNPLNDLFTFSITIEIGTHHDDRLSLATQLLDKSGTKRFDTEELQKEWYKLGTAFGLGAGDNETTISISGLDENFDKSIRLLRELLDNPVATEETLAELKQIVFVQREDAKKDYRTIGAALYQYNRYGKESTFLRALPNDAIAKLTTKELAEIIQGLLKYKHSIAYTGSRSLDNVLGVLKKDYPLVEKLETPPDYKFLKVTAPKDTRIYFFHKEMAQAQVRMEFGDGTFDEANAAAVQLYNDYFAGGMSGIVFQELREARALAYSVGAVYSNGGRKGEQNVMVGVIGSQADKTPEALTAFLDLLDNLPKSPERFDESRDSILNRYRTSKLGFREVLGAVRSWEKLEVPIDPRKARFGQIEKGSLEGVLKFHAEHLKGKPKLISIVGDKSKVNLEALKKHGEVVELKQEDIFSF